MIKQDYILLIMNCERYRKKALLQKSTWLVHLPEDLIYYQCIGNPDLETDFLFNDCERILYVKTQDDYNSLPHKVITAFQAIASKYEYKYILKTDDDQMLENPKFFDMVMGLTTRMEPKVHYGGMIVDVKRAHTSQYFRIHPELPNDISIAPIKYCNGRFYLLSNDAIINLLSKKKDIQTQYLEDYAVGFYLDEKLKTNILSIQSQKFFTDCDPIASPSLEHDP